MSLDTDVLSFRCKHRHTAESHPQCYQRYLQNGKIESLKFKSPRHIRSARILLLDIETLPGEYYAFAPKVEYLSPDKQIKSWSIACWAAKWLLDPDIMGEVVNAKDAFERKDLSILGGIWRLIDEADIVVTQNGIEFDIPKLFTRFIDNQIKPPTKFSNIDTLKTAKKVFGFDYNRLDELGKRFGIGKKIDMSFLDWKNCLSNNSQAEFHLQNMLAYCKQDIAPLLEDVYLAMLPYIPNHPNLGIYTNHDKDVCPKCESFDITWNEKPYATPQGLWMSFRCQSCGAVGRGTSKEYSIKKVSMV